MTTPPPSPAQAELGFAIAALMRAVEWLEIDKGDKAKSAMLDAWECVTKAWREMERVEVTQ